MHESIDATLERATQFIWNKAVLITLIATNFISKSFNSVYDYSSISLQGAMDAHKEKVWVFTSRNSIPWVTLSEEYSYDNLREVNKYPIVYYPQKKHMYINPGNTFETKTFGDVVLANMSKPDGTVKIEMSSTFHNIYWTSSGDSPSLYEVALIHCLSHKLVFTEKEMVEFTLEFLTADANTVNISMQNAKEVFSGWESSSETDSEFKNSIYNDDIQDNSESEERPKID
jgi:hypothetical protein